MDITMDRPLPHAQAIHPIGAPYTASCHITGGVIHNKSVFSHVFNKPETLPEMSPALHDY